MRSNRGLLVLVGSLALATTSVASATEPIKPPDAPAAAAAFAANLKAEYFAEYDDAAGKLEQLAAAIPAEKYSWRPSDGVRSTSEVFMHVAGGQYFLMRMNGLNPPDDLPKDLEKMVTEKTQVIAWLKRSLADGRQAAEQATPEQMEKTVDFFGRQKTGRALYLRMLIHMNEHLGQAIAYARVGGVVPPWSRGE